MGVEGGALPGAEVELVASGLLIVIEIVNMVTIIVTIIIMAIVIGQIKYCVILYYIILYYIIV